MTKLVFNILAICGAAGFFGVMLSIGITLGGYWRSLPPEQFLEWFAANNRYVAASVPVIVLPTLIGLIGSVWLARQTPAFGLWGASFACIAVVLVFTVAYFVPTNTAFANGSIDPAAVSDKLSQWVLFHYGRIGFALLAAVLGCLAMRAGVSAS